MKRNGAGIIGIIIAILVVLGIWGVGQYNGLVGRDETVNEAAAQIDVMLQRRADLIPNVVETVKGYTQHEESVLKELAEARAKLSGAQTMSEKSEADKELTGALSRLLVVVENYPELKADKGFQDLRVELEGAENRIQVVRSDYNKAATEFNRKLRSFPTNIIGKMLGFERRTLFEATEGAQEVPKVDFNTNKTQSE